MSKSYYAIGRVFRVFSNGQFGLARLTLAANAPADAKPIIAGVPAANVVDRRAKKRDLYVRSLIINLPFIVECENDIAPSKKGDGKLDVIFATTGHAAAPFDRGVAEESAAMLRGAEQQYKEKLRLVTPLPEELKQRHKQILSEINKVHAAATRTFMCASHIRCDCERYVKETLRQAFDGAEFEETRLVSFDKLGGAAWRFVKKLSVDRCPDPWEGPNGPDDEVSSEIVYCPIDENGRVDKTVDVAKLLYTNDPEYIRVIAENQEFERQLAELVAERHAIAQAADAQATSEARRLGISVRDARLRVLM